MLTENSRTVTKSTMSFKRPSMTRFRDANSIQIASSLRANAILLVINKCQVM